jgi:lactate dehydrogenase-like 2-hydroxyacid dehydrogenase
MKFKKIVLVDDCRLDEKAIEKIALMSDEKIDVYHDYPETVDEINRRIQHAECILVSSKTKIDASILQTNTSLKYIGMCCSLYDERSANVDIQTAHLLGIAVKGVKDYGDEGTVEFIFAQLICLFKGIGAYQWRLGGTELKNKSIGIIGLGTLGQMVAKTAIHFGMQVFYYSRTRKHALESEQLNFLPLEDILALCDVVTVHVPKRTIVLNEEGFRIKKRNSVLINTSLGLTFEKEAFIQWLGADKSSYAILDRDGAGEYYSFFSTIENILLYNSSAGFTTEARERLSEKVYNNLTGFLSKE